MKKVFVFSLVTLLMCSACKFSFDKDDHDVRFLNEPTKTFNNQKVDLDNHYVNSLKEFASSFYKQINEGENEIFSPISIATCFSMLLDGAKEESQTELEVFLHYNDSFNHLNEIKNMLLNSAISRTDPDVILDIAQSLWVDDSFENAINQDYVDKLTDYYYAEAMQGKLAGEIMHNALADYINKKTYDFFDLTGEDFKDFDGVLWLLNTIYLKSPWKTQFNENDNVEDTFSNLSGGETNVTYMVKTLDNDYYYDENYLISSFDLESSLKLNVLLPNEDADYQAILSNDENISSLLNYHLESPNKSRGCMHYRLPQFRLTENYNLEEILQEMNVKKIFNPEEANLKGICDLPNVGNLYVGKAVHGAGIAVDNNGVEAAAYTVIDIRESSSGPEGNEDVYFYVNRPFAYTITSGDDLPLFMGVTYSL
ncbi:MAG TPA: serpin family protein [Erysipelotrichaceae bacterium]|nr:serpin family protein [Erysipelotrichaceae bacterium]